MEVVPAVPGDPRGQGEGEAGLRELRPTPGDDLSSGSLVHVGPHALLVARGAELLPRAGRSGASEQDARRPGAGRATRRSERGTAPRARRRASPTSGGSRARRGRTPSRPPPSRPGGGRRPRSW